MKKTARALEVPGLFYLTYSPTHLLTYSASHLPTYPPTHLLTYSPRRAAANAHALLALRSPGRAPFRRTDRPHEKIFATLQQQRHGHVENRNAGGCFGFDGAVVSVAVEYDVAADGIDRLQQA